VKRLLAILALALAPFGCVDIHAIHDERALLNEKLGACIGVAERQQAIIRKLRGQLEGSI
jgi:hypothetical protein